MPEWPTDVFAVAAYLLDRGGVYHRIVPDAARELQRGKAAYGPMTPPWPPFKWDELNLELEYGDILELKKKGASWRAAFQAAAPSLFKRALTVAAPSEVDRPLHDAIENIWEEINSTCWAALIEDPALPIVKRPKPEKLPWWKPAIELLIISDEAAQGLGFEGTSPEDAHYCEIEFRRQAAIDKDFFSQLTSSWRVYDGKRTTFTAQVQQSLVRVVPKSQTPLVGCTLRSLSHNLAMVPPEGVVDIAWCRDFDHIDSREETLNILLVPFPYTVSANSFIGVADDPHHIRPDQPWGWFHVAQRWLEQTGKIPEEPVAGDPSREELCNFILHLIEKAELDCGQVHGVILPEVAIDWHTYRLLVEALLARKSPIEFFISGCSCDHVGRWGNYAVTTTFGPGAAGIQAVTNVRAKHHRWRLDAAQIARYGLASALDASHIWWEGTELPRREIGVTVFRGSQTFSTMICEDLARSDPVHEPLRAVGPNLVFVLLMDGVQAAQRWSARSTLSLADDPSSSVLTLTSLGLVERSNATSARPSRAIAIWKDVASPIVAIECPPRAHAVLLTAVREPAVEATLDGRSRTDKTSWRYSGHQPVYGDVSATNEWIVKGGAPKP